jgi:hypothetical protein
MGKQIVSLSEVLNQRRRVLAPYFGNEVEFAYNPGSFDDDLMNGINTGEGADLIGAVLGVIGDDEDLAERIVDAIQTALREQNAAEYILEALKRVVVDLPLKDDQGQIMGKDAALEAIPVPLRGSIFQAMTLDMQEGQKKPNRMERKRQGSKQPRSSFDAT